jgi:lipid A 4'-phosphatase
MKKTVYRDFFVPAIILCVLTAVFRLTNLDLHILDLFFTRERGWFLQSQEPWDFLYDYGAYPAFLMVIAALLVFGSGFLSKRLSPLRRIALFLVLMMLLGPGLAVNGIKSQWGRPRPREIRHFDGDQKFRPVWNKGEPGDYASFPSGHAAMGYYLVAPFFVLRKRRRRWAYLFLILGIGYGSLIGFARMVQGAHFPSDIVWSGGLVYLTGLILSYAFQFQKGIHFCRD